MGDINERLFVERLAGRLQGPFLEVGSRDYGNTQSFRTLFAEQEYVGVDMEDGPGVDLVMDLTGAFPDIDAGFHGRRFGTIFCMSVLEHCDQPFRMADNLTRLLKPGGWLCISAPFAWRIHAYPNDYWRFTPAGIAKLFPLVQFDWEQCLSAAAGSGEFRRLDDDLGKIFFSFKRHWEDGHPMRGLSAQFLRILSRTGWLAWLVRHRYVFAPTAVLMIGRRQDTEDRDRTTSTRQA